MSRNSLALGVAFAALSFASADDAPRGHGAPPRLLIASGIDAHGNLVLSSTEQRQKKVPREVTKDGKKTIQEMTVTFPVTVLGRQTVSLKDVMIYDRDGKTLSLDQAHERLNEPTPVLVTVLGEKVDPLYLKIMTKDTLTFTFSWIPEFKELPKDPHAAAEPKRKGAIAVGERVPDFSIRTLDGETIKLSELQKDDKRTKSGVVVLSFWCATCSSCRRVEHQLDKLAKDYAGQAAVLALDANMGESADKVAAFAKEKKLSLPIVLDPSGRSANIFGTEVTTTTVVIDGNGVLRYCGRFKQGDRAATAEDALKAVLAGKEVAVKTTPHDG